MTNMNNFSFYEFFAGAGMARAGLGDNWSCAFANEFDVKKAAVYRKNWLQPDVLKVADVRDLEASDLPGEIADLVWASFPCQDLSLAGAGAGLKGDRSGTFWPFWDLMQELIEVRRSPRLIVLENVCGMLTSHGGKDFAAIGSAYVKSGYRFGAVVADAVHFVPQSRPRLFIIGVRDCGDQMHEISGNTPTTFWHPRNLMTAYDGLSARLKEKWLWWKFPAPISRVSTFSELVEDNPIDVEWHSSSETTRLLKLMSPINREKVEKAKRSGRRMVGTIYKRTRRDDFGRKVQRAEVRFDDIAGCLRTPAGGSSRQVIMIVQGRSVRSRLISPRETARLMGLRDSYELPENYNEAYHLTGDGVVVPVVRHLARYLFEPLLCTRQAPSRAAA